jgi:hypothetical protein
MTDNKRMRSVASSVLIELWILCLPFWVIGAVLAAAVHLLYDIATFVMPVGQDRGKFDWRGFPWFRHYWDQLDGVPGVEVEARK